MYKYLYKLKDGEKMESTAVPANPILPNPSECPTPELKKLYTAMNKEVNKSLVLSPSRGKGAKYNKFTDDERKNIATYDVSGSRTVTVG